MEYLYCGLIGYLFGTVNPSYFLARLKGFDIREKGSKNAGASNALILFGKTIGILCALFDIAKTYFAIMLAERLFEGRAYVYAVTAVACVLGHVFPFYMKFKGGKGTACLGGLILYFDWRVLLILLAATIIIVLITDYLLFMPIVGSVSFLLVYGLMSNDWWSVLILSVVPIVILIKNIENFKRVKNGTEMRISYLWKPDSEMDRMQENLSVSDEDIKEHFSAKTKKQQ